MPNVAVVLSPLVVIVCLDVWVYMDATARAGTSREVGVRIGSFTVDSPIGWLVGCAVLFVIFFPLYRVARREAVTTDVRYGGSAGP